MTRAWLAAVAIGSFLLLGLVWRQLHRHSGTNYIYACPSSPLPCPPLPEVECGSAAVGSGKASSVNNRCMYVLNSPSPTTMKEKINDYYKCHRELVLQGCGEICDTTLEGTPSKFFNFIAKQVDCDALWANTGIDQTNFIWPPVDEPPTCLREDYTYQGRVQVEQQYRVQKYLGAKALKSVWLREEVEAMRQAAGSGRFEGSYGADAVQRLQAGLAEANIKDKHVLVIGSESPWVEAICLHLGAKRVTTLEYGAIESKHEQIDSIAPQEARQLFKEGRLSFDVIVTYSSVEHSGLGRYGDELNPWGDLQSVARAYCITKPGGKLVISVPNHRDESRILFNAHRIYGPVMYSHLTANWHQLWRSDSPSAPSGHEVFVFKRE